MKNKFFITLFACLLPWMAGAQQTIFKQNNVAEKDYIAYLFTYFTGNHISEEAVCYAVSTDGYTYWALNDNKPVIDSQKSSVYRWCARSAYPALRRRKDILYGGYRYGF